MTEEDQGVLEVLGWSKGTDHLKIAIRPMPADFEAVHTLCMEKGYYTLTDIWAAPDGSVYRVMKLTSAGKDRLAELERMRARSKLVGADGNPLQ